MSAPRTQDANLDRFEFRTEFPEWVDESHEGPHVGVREEVTDGRADYYKALLLKDNGEYRWRVWQEGSDKRMPYGPDLPPEIANMLMAWMNEVR